MFLESAINPSHRRGWIEIICGSMFSGKTEELIRRLNRARIAKQRVEIFKPSIDTRYDETNVVSHNENSITSTPVQASSQILIYANNVDVVGIDEAQFFDTAEYVTKVHAICMQCGNLAHYSHRKTADEKLVMLGETESYEPLCRECFTKARSK